MPSVLRYDAGALGSGGMRTMESPTAEAAPPRFVEAELGFARLADVSPDTERAGLLRAATLPSTVDVSASLDFRRCRVVDCATAEGPRPTLSEVGFDTIDLSRLNRLERLLARVRAADALTPEDAAAIRRALLFRSFRLSDGKRMRILFVASEGTILRKSGPNGMKVDPGEKLTPTSGHDAATAVHGDQDVRGTPLRQLLGGAAPWLFQHRSPDGENRRSPLHLVNVWIPLQQITRPLALMDGRTLDRRRHQLRYALPTDAFLEREASLRVNDIWSYLHDPAQQWYFTSEMGPERAYVFETLSTPHGAFVVPGEDRAEQLYLRLRAVRDAIARGDADGARQAARSGDRSSAPRGTTIALARAIDTMQALLVEADARASELVGDAGVDFGERAAAAMDRVVRKSIELRAVAWVTPDWLAR